MKPGFSVLFVVAFLQFSFLAHGDTQTHLTYSNGFVWSSAIRYLRVDQQFKIIEKDKDAGYLLFEYKERGQSYHAALEFIPVVQENKQYLRVKIKINGMPKYVETVLMDGFLRKLKQEYGDQPPARQILVENKNEQKAQLSNASDEKNDTQKTDVSNKKKQSE